MLPRTQRLLLAIVLVCITVAQARAQRLPSPTLDSLDFDVLNSDTIAIGTATVDDSRPNMYELPLTVKVNETLRGTPGDQITGRVRTSAAQLPKNGSKILVFANADNPLLRAINLDDPKVLAATSDFRILRGAGPILAYVRAAILKHPTAKKIKSFASWPPDDEIGRKWSKEFPYFVEGGLVVPVDELLEKRAFEAVHSKDRSRAWVAGNALKLFPSNKNIERLKVLLKDPYFLIILKAEDWNGTEIRFYPARQSAVNVLKFWGVPFDEPVTDERISRVATIKSLHVVPSMFDGGVPWLKDAVKLEELEIPYGSLSDEEFSVIGHLTRLKKLSVGRTKMDDAHFERLSELVNLRILTIDGNPITDNGLKVLSHFTQLKELSLFDTQVTAAGIADLKKARPSLKVTTVKVEKKQTR